MANEMSWKECIDRGIITETQADEERSNQMLQMANLRLEFWDKNVDDKFIALKVEAYYDIIKELIFAHIYKNGYNCTNHLVSFPILRRKCAPLILKFKRLMNYEKSGMKLITGD